ncbi:MAG: ferrochelatase [Deltaproteobacteria bacterium]|nr:ferrochelatase [Deltaproteobacteria bacterium]
MKNQKRGIILLNMGGPGSQDDVAPFLFNLFSDREIIRLGPGLLQKPIAWFISHRRAPKSRAIYAKIGGGSPLLNITLQQAAALQKMLEEKGDFPVTVAMRYWQPFAEEAINRLLNQGVDSITAVTLYPHFSRATTGSSVNNLQKHLTQRAPRLPLNIINSYPTQPSYIKGLAENIMAGLHEFDSDHVQIIYSAHSLPMSFVREGDPYVDHLKKTITAVEEITGLQGRLCYQSRSGPVEWLSPSTPEMLKTLAEEECRNILAVPISFVSDHIETLYEINMLYREQAKKLGMRLRPSPSLNTSPLFINCLKELVLQVKSTDRDNQSTGGTL